MSESGLRLVILPHRPDGPSSRILRMTLPLRHTCALVLAGAALFAAGCGSEEGIRTYKAPPDPKRMAAYRILGALYPADNPVWYFKFAGSIEELTKHEGAWEKLIVSVKSKNDMD